MSARGMSSLPPALMRPLVLPRENLIVRTHIIWGAAQADHESHRIDRFSEKYTRWGADSPGEGRAIRILQVNFPPFRAFTSSRASPALPSLLTMLHHSRSSPPTLSP